MNFEARGAPLHCIARYTEPTAPVKLTESFLFNLLQFECLFHCYAVSKVTYITSTALAEHSHPCHTGERSNRLLQLGTEYLLQRGFKPVITSKPRTITDRLPSLVRDGCGTFTEY